MNEWYVLTLVAYPLPESLSVIDPRILKEEAR